MAHSGFGNSGAVMSWMHKMRFTLSERRKLDCMPVNHMAGHGVVGITCVVRNGEGWDHCSKRRQGKCQDECTVIISGLSLKCMQLRREDMSESMSVYENALQR